jgi:predicted Abi (CAAX) family protease
MTQGNYWQIVVGYAIAIWGIWCCITFAQPVLNTPNPTVATAPPSTSAQSVQNAQNNYRPNGEWNGRLILPTPAQIAKSALKDWAWLEVQQAPVQYPKLIGQTVALTWNLRSTIAADISQVTTDINFTPATLASQKSGSIHPQRLDGRQQVGPLQSLAGSRPADDVWVKLTDVKIDKDNNLTIDREPIQITGKLKGLVKIVGVDRQNSAPLPTSCPVTRPCASEYFSVQHYNPQAQKFDTTTTTIRIPQIAARSSGLFPSTTRDLEKSPAGADGWYIYGDFSSGSDIFTVAALQPRSLLSVYTPREIVTNNDLLNYFNHQHWQQTPQRKGQLDRVGFGVLPKPNPGDTAIVIHTFGGIDGKTADIPGVWQTVTGHFAYGTATLNRDDFTNELQWDINYNQIYAHNPDGIIAGEQDWATYMGNLERGWLATRPVADLLITYPPVTEDYDFGGIKISPLTELKHQLHLFAARYRTGDGTGGALVSPAKSCVQDSNQALYVTIQRLTDRVRSQPQIQTWLNAHPQDPQGLRFQKLQALSKELQQQLTPLGIVRSDWQQNAAKLVGIDRNAAFQVSTNPLIALASWRTMLPRGAQDGMGKIFSRLGASLWFLTTFQVGGVNPDIFPIAPTILFGQSEVLAKVLLRLWSGLSALPTGFGWLSAIGLLVSYGIVALGFGWKTGFLQFDRQLQRPWWRESLFLIQLLILPATIEEILFRLLLIPHPIETATSTEIGFWSIGSLLAFILYHPLNALTFYPAGKPTFMDWRFLTLAGLLGAVCAISYYTTGSLWPSILIHWIVVTSWIEFFGGRRMLSQK